MLGQEFLEVCLELLVGQHGHGQRSVGDGARKLPVLEYAFELTDGMASMRLFKVVGHSVHCIQLVGCCELGSESPGCVE